MKIGIDLALRKTAIVVLSNGDKLVDFVLFDSDPKEYNNEDLLLHNTTRVTNFILGLNEGLKQKINLNMEGLSFNSKSSNIDLIDGNHWMLRCHLKSLFPNIIVNIIYPKSWQKSIVTKEILSEWAKKWPIIRAKRGIKLTKEEQKANNKSKAEIRKLTKAYIVSQVPQDIKDKFLKYITDNKLKKESIEDLCDAYFITRYSI